MSGWVGSVDKNRVNYSSFLLLVDLRIVESEGSRRHVFDRREGTPSFRARTLTIIAVPKNRSLCDMSRSVYSFICIYNDSLTPQRWLEAPSTQDMSVRRLVVSRALAEPLEILVVGATRRSQGCLFQAKSLFNLKAKNSGHK